MDRDGFQQLFDAYLEQRRFMEAMVIAKKAAITFPDEPFWSLCMARLYLAQGKASRAARELKTILEKWPGYTPARALAETLPN